jgi:hypothetical protein
MAGLTGGGVSSRSAYQPIVYTEKANFYLEAAASHTHRTAIGHLSDGVARQGLRRVSADSCTAGKRPLGDQQTSDVARSLATGPAIGCPRSAGDHGCGIAICGFYCGVGAVYMKGLLHALHLNRSGARYRVGGGYTRGRVGSAKECKSRACLGPGRVQQAGRGKKFWSPCHPA